MDKKLNQVELMVEIRFLVGFLGEKEQFNWWSSNFLSPSSPAFLSPIFTRSQFLAQYHGVVAAAQKAHDELIGVGQTVHLFRLPLTLEQSAHHVVEQPEFGARLKGFLVDKSSALERLKSLQIDDHKSITGPLLVGNASEDMVDDLKKVSSIYLSSFTQGIKTFPYFKVVE